MAAHLMKTARASALYVRALAKARDAAARSAVVSSRSMGGRPEDDWPVKVQIGKREVVGFGANGDEVYFDDVHNPFPAIRFKEDDAQISALRQKEKGDWKKLTLEEKKTLYRASFAQTLVESEAKTGEWKGVLGIALILISAGIWSYMGLKAFVYPEWPASITDEEHMKEQIQKMIDMRVNPVEGLTSNYDYEKNEWKWNK